MKSKLNKRKGISLIVLVITIIVMIILATSIILSLNSSGIIEKANDAVYQSDMKAMEEELTVKLADAMINGELDQYNDVAAEEKLETAKKYPGMFRIINQKLVYVGEIIEIDSADQIYALSRILSSDWAKNKYYATANNLSLQDDFEYFEVPTKFTTDDEKIEYLQTASYKLMNDIDIVLDTTTPYEVAKWNTEKFLGIGNYHYPFKGTFDGNNKTITMSSTNNHETHSYSADNIGFFGDTSGANICNTKIVVSSDMTATSSSTSDSRFGMGALIGEARTTNITNCSATFTNVNFGLNISADNFDDYGHIGGLVGNADLSIFTNCHVILNDSSIYGQAKNVDLPYKYGGISVGGILGNSLAGSDNTNNLGRLSNQLYNCTVVSNNTSQRDVIYASIEGGTECTVGGILGMTYNNGLIKDCSVDITKGNIKSTQTSETVSTNLGSAVGGIVGRMEHTSQAVGCKVDGDYLNITSYGADNTHLVGGIVGNAYGAIHRDVTPVLNCHFDGSSTSTLSIEVNATNPNENSHHVGIGGIVGLLQYQMYDSSVKDVKIINKSEGMSTSSVAGEIVGYFEANSFSNGTWTAGTPEIKRCTASGITFDLSSNVAKTNLE